MLTENQIKDRLIRNFADARQSVANTFKGELDRYHSGRMDAIAQSYAEVFDTTWQQAWDTLHSATNYFDDYTI